MLIYKIEWKKDGKTGSFESSGLTDEECIQGGHDEVHSFGGEVTDYYQVYPSTKPLIDKFLQIKTKKESAGDDGNVIQR